MKHTYTVRFVFFLTASIAIVRCSDPGSKYVGEAGDYQPPSHRITVPLYCDNSEADHFNSSMSPFRWGGVQVDINVDVAVDFRCPHCASFAKIIDSLWGRRADFRDRVRVTFHHFPNEALHPGATEIHVASAAVANQGFDNFWRLHDEILTRAVKGEKMDRLALDQYIEQELDLDFERYLLDVEADETKDFVQWDKQQCRAAGVAGTPSVFVCGALLYDRSQLEETIDRALEESQTDE